MGTLFTSVNTGALDLLTIGEPIICLDTGGLRLEEANLLSVSLGGTECNLAIGLARLGYRTAVAGRIGDDPFGRAVRRRLLAEQVDISSMVVDETAPTAVLFKERSYRGPEVHYRRAQAAGERISVDDVPVARTARARRIHVTGVTAALGHQPRQAVLAMMQHGRRAGARVSFDANFRRKLGSVSDLVAMFHALLPLADEVLLGWGEASLLAGSDSEDAIRSLAASLQRPCVVVKRPAGGAICLESGRWVEHAVAPVTVVDAVGAGDGFAVGFLHERLRGSSTSVALASGSAIAARVVTRRGDNEGLPYASELDGSSEGLPYVTELDGADAGVVR